MRSGLQSKGVFIRRVRNPGHAFLFTDTQEQPWEGKISCLWANKRPPCRFDFFKSHFEQTKCIKFASGARDLCLYWILLRLGFSAWDCLLSPKLTLRSWSCFHSKPKPEWARVPPLTHPPPHTHLSIQTTAQGLNHTASMNWVPFIYQVFLQVKWWPIWTGSLPSRTHGIQGQMDDKSKAAITTHAGEGETQTQVCHENWDCLQPDTSTQDKNQSRLHQCDFIICSGNSCPGR